MHNVREARGRAFRGPACIMLRPPAGIVDGERVPTGRELLRLASAQSPFPAARGNDQRQQIWVSGERQFELAPESPNEGCHPE